MSLLLRSLLLCVCWPLLTQAATNSLRPWNDYRVIMWIGDTVWQKPDKVPLFFQRLREMGVNTAMVSGDGDTAPLLENRFPYYVENMVNRGLCLKYSSKVVDWDAFVTQWARNGRSETNLIRDYCLDAPEWRAWARKSMQELVRKHMTNAPFAYDIRDELSTTISANPFDYDFNPVTLAKFRDWLKTQYAGLDALNAAWETPFATWESVRPFTTDQIKQRMESGEAMPRGKPDWQAVQRLKFDPLKARQSPTRWNLSPWTDFRTYMDISLATALNDIRSAAHELDPLTPVGIEGTQMPSAFGGYDLWRMSQVLDWIEPYDIGCSREILGSFMPGKPILTTVGENNSQHALRRLWHLLLEGDRGCIVWWSEDCIDWKSSDYALTAKGRALMPALKEMTSREARLFLRAERVLDPVFIHYSQTSIQVDWLLESCPDGSTWLRRFSSFEADHNRQAAVRASWLKAVQDLGFSPQFISTEQIESGALGALRNAALILPNSFALSDKETAAIRQFVAPTNPALHTLLCDGTPGLFDGHGRLRTKSGVEDYFPPSASSQAIFARQSGDENSANKNTDIAQYVRERANAAPDLDLLKWLQPALNGLRPEVSCPPNARLRIHRYKLGSARLLAFERNINYQMSEDLKQVGGNEPLEKPFATEVRLGKPAYVYDLRTHQYLGFTDTMPLQLDPWQPSMFALLDEKLPAEQLLVRLETLAGISQ